MNKSIAERVFNQIVVILDAFKQEHGLESEYWRYNEPRWFLKDKSRQVEVRFRGESSFYLPALEFYARNVMPGTSLNSVGVGILDVRFHLEEGQLSPKIDMAKFEGLLVQSFQQMQEL